jgi:putative polyhydroxyalkanoate system protein
MSVASCSSIASAQFSTRNRPTALLRCGRMSLHRHLAKTPRAATMPDREENPMSHIDIRKRHNKPLKQAKQCVDRVAKHIAEKFDVDYAWEGSTLEFSRSGVDGHINVGSDEIHVRATLGFLLGMLKGPIEDEIQRYLDEEFD